MKLSAKFEEIAARRVEPASIAAVARLLRDSPFPPSEELVELVAACGADRVLFDEMVVFRPASPTPWDGDGLLGLDELYGCQGIVVARKRYSGRLPAAYLPIGESDGGNLICYGLEDGRVYFWDHEDERPETDYVGNLHVIGETLGDFVAGLFVEECEESEDEDLGIESVEWH